jgi:hypothetical protein
MLSITILKSKGILVNIMLFKKLLRLLKLSNNLV